MGRAWTFLLLLAACQTSSPVPPAVPPTHVPFTDGVVDVGGGMSLHMHCVGDGAPTVVMDAGLGTDGSAWGEVQGEIGRFVRVCVYDRAGLGYSSRPAPKSHTNRQMAHELHALLERSGVAGPYVLVAHSMGGINIRLFASEHPDEVAGMVLVDATQDPVHTRSTLSDPELAESKANMLESNEGIDFDMLVAGAAEMRASSHTIGSTPLVVLTHGKPDESQDDAGREKAAQKLRVWQEAQADLPRLSTNSVQVVADKSGHFIQFDQPKLVIASVRQVVEAARTHGRVDASLLAPLANEGPP